MSLSFGAQILIITIKILIVILLLMKSSQKYIVYWPLEGVINNNFLTNNDDMVKIKEVLS